VSKGPQNRILARRKELGLSQRELAKAAGTSQQQVQRIETGVQTARLDLAARIAASLSTSLTDLFPKLPAKRVGKRQKAPKGIDPQLSEEKFLAAGIDPDPRHWTIKVGFEDGREFFYRVSGTDKERISSIIWNATFDFIVFDTRDRRVAINRSAINYCNFSF
jgi:transcriptional regulator with XRE-family HTH domain